jgi:hypothetical protein
MNTDLATLDWQDDVDEEQQPEPLKQALILYAPGDNPADMGFPPMLPVELAMGEDSPREVCAAYNITKERFAKLITLPAFATAYKNALEMLQKQGMSFRIKAQMQAEEYLKTMWALVHSPHTPANIKADLIKTTIRAAGLEPKESDRAPVMPLQINIQL